VPLGNDASPPPGKGGKWLVKERALRQVFPAIIHRDACNALEGAEAATCTLPQRDMEEKELVPSRPIQRGERRDRTVKGLERGEVLLGHQ